MENSIVLKRKRGPDWVFEYEDGAYIYRTKKNKYRLFIDDVWADIWVGRLSNWPSGYWLLDHSGVRPVSAKLLRGTYFFE